MNLQNDNRIFLSLASASANYTKPDAVMDAFTSWLGQELPEFACMIHRLEVYADLGNEKNINLYRWNPLAWKFNKLKTGESSDEINSNNHGTLR